KAEVWLKLEIVQTTGSFKLRGAANALAVLADRRPGVAGVVTASAGNHGLAMAWAAKQLGLSTRVYVPAGAPPIKRHAMIALGAEVVETPSYDDAESEALGDARRNGLTYVSPYNDDHVIAGAGTVALEMFSDCPGLDTIVAPLGGGGLLAGTAVAARSIKRDAWVIGAEAEASPVFTTSLASGRIVAVDVKSTLADGLAGNLQPGSRTFALVSDLTDRVVLVAEGSIELAMRDLIRRERLVAEGASATAVGALLQGGLDLAGRRVAVILTGRNVDAQVLERVFGRG
ncbi:MAG TPA: threonine/serine dehydratase, partial [Vicinamibacterales bacterium]